MVKIVVLAGKIIIRTKVLNFCNFTQKSSGSSFVNQTVFLRDTHAHAMIHETSRVECQSNGHLQQDLSYRIIMHSSDMRARVGRSVHDCLHI